LGSFSFKRWTRRGKKENNKQFEINSIAKILICGINYIIVVLIVFCPTSGPIIGSGLSGRD
jgi:hypothetical protein